MENTEFFKISLDQESQLHSIREKLFDKIAIFTVSFGIIALAGSILRIFRFGLKINIIIDIITYFLLVFIVLLRKKISGTFAITIYLTTLFLFSCINFFFVGLATINTTLLTACCIITGAIFGFKKGLMMLLSALVIISIAGILFTTGKINNIFDLNTYLNTPHAWISQLTGFFVYALACLIIINFIYQQLWNFLNQLKERSEELYTKEKKYRLLAENMRDVLVVFDINYCISYISPSVNKIFGYSEKEFLSKKIDSFLTEKNRTFFDSLFRDFFENPQQYESTTIPLEFEFQRKDGSIFFGEIIPSLVRNKSGTLEGIQAIIRDITERKKSEQEKTLLREQLLQAEKMQVLGKIAGGIAHDFNNQLAGILGFAELIKSEEQKDSECFVAAEAIIKIVKRSSDLISKLLAFARKGNYRVELIDIHQLIDEVMTILSRSIDKTITLSKNFLASVSYIKGDPSQIQNALLNIGLNARDAMPNGGIITFTTQISEIPENFVTPYQTSIKAGKYLQISIADTGTGIEEEIKKHIFEPFFTTKKDGKGSGMGLAAVFGTVEAHKGIIDVESEVNKGSTFHLYFPLEEEKIENKKTKELKSSSISNENKERKGKILVVEDEESIRKMISMLLSKVGYSSSCCEDGKTALSLYEKEWENFDAIILDLILPEISGKELFERLHLINPEVRILLYSGYSPDKEVQRLLKHKKTLFMQKPFTIKELSEKLETLLHMI
ncbi:MAG: PAS domain S-box protein [Chitinispirillaceae bacterium]|nr:PAS domain S-box protein [Chitinispirillaceae bacterium]